MSNERHCYIHSHDRISYHNPSYILFLTANRVVCSGHASIFETVFFSQAKYRMAIATSLFYNHRAGKDSITVNCITFSSSCRLRLTTFFHILSNTCPQLIMVIVEHPYLINLNLAL